MRLRAAIRLLSPQILSFKLWTSLTYSWVYTVAGRLASGQNNKVQSDRAQDVRELAEELMGPIDAVSHQPYGHAGQSFEIRAASGDFIIKTRDQHGAFDQTERHVRVLGDLGIRTPTVLQRGSFRGFEYLLYAKIPGCDLGHALADMTKSQMTMLATEIVSIERKVTSLPKGVGFGWTTMEAPGPFPSWTSVIERDAQVAPDTVLGEVKRWRQHFDAIEPTCFLDDLTVKNVIVENGAFQGIVDVDEVCYGDPLYWISLAEVTTVLDVGLPASFYGDELRRLWGLSEKESADCDLYNVIQSWFFLGKNMGHLVLAKWAARRFDRVHTFG